MYFVLPAFKSEESMPLVVGTILLVVVVTTLVGLAAWLVDRTTARHEQRK